MTFIANRAQTDRIRQELEDGREIFWKTLSARPVSRLLIDDPYAGNNPDGSRRETLWAQNQPYEYTPGVHRARASEWVNPRVFGEAAIEAGGKRLIGAGVIHVWDTPNDHGLFDTGGPVVEVQCQLEHFVAAGYEEGRFGYHGDPLQIAFTQIYLSPVQFDKGLEQARSQTRDRPWDSTYGLTPSTLLPQYLQPQSSWFLQTLHQPPQPPLTIEATTTHHDEAYTADETAAETPFLRRMSRRLLGRRVRSAGDSESRD